MDPQIGAAGDIDTAVTVLTHADGTFTTIDNSREAVYGYAYLVDGGPSPAGTHAALASTAVALAARESLRSGQPVAVDDSPAPLLPIDRIAGAPISWRLCEVPGWGYQLTPDRVLGEMHELGLGATEVGPPGFLEVDAAARVQQLASYGMKAVGGFHVALFHDPGHDPLPAVDAFIRECLAADADVVVLAAHTGSDGYDSRPMSTMPAGPRCSAPRSTCRPHSRARGRGHLHPHIGTMIENDAEVRRVIAGSPIGLCIDTGHLAAAVPTRS